ncbi:MAG: RagB/SusD family nutrient uptake outer membrane protein [Paludibacteraceae bacterium]|nr:RagB/SusD family nutrient uptake outer membrane protein [Paludibacteraceae bacterium]
MKKTIYICAMLVAALSMTSCDAFLTPVNKTAGGQTAEQYFSENPEALLTYAYSLTRSLVFNDINTVNLMCDGTDLYQPSRNQTATEFQQYTMNAENSTVETFYKNAFSCINNANAAIFYAEKSDVSNAASIIAQARFIRSWAYYMLSQQFGRVPYITTYVNSAERNYPLCSTKELYDNVIADLKDVVRGNDLLDTDATGRANKAACWALMAKLNLAAGWDLEVTGEGLAVSATGNTYFQAAVVAADSALTLSGNTTLSLTNEQKWSPAYEDNVEVLFAIQWCREGNPGEDAKGGHGLQNTFGNYYGDCTTTGLKYVNSRLAPTPKALLLWEEGDKRYEAYFMTQLANYNGADYAWGSHGYYGYYNNNDFANLSIAYKYFPAWTSVADAKAWVNAHADQFKNIEGGANSPTAYIMSDPVVRININEDGTVKSTDNLNFQENINSLMQFCPPLKKWDDPNSIQLALTTANSYRNVPVLHASDLYLIEAEAYYMMNNESEALKRLNAVRSRAGLAELSSMSAYSAPYAVAAGFEEGNIDFILDERARELYGECQRWMDLRRTRQLVRYNKAFNIHLAGEVKTYRPIPQTEINSNSALTNEDQNPGF